MDLTNLENLKKLKILLIGFGAENQAIYKWLLDEQKLSLSQIFLIDSQEPKNWNLESNLYFGENYLTQIESIKPDLIIKSPGIWSLLPELVDFRQKYGQDKVISGLAFFVSKFRDQVIAITGTKGKSTTSSLITFLLKKNQINNYYLGNTVGVSPYEYWQEFTSQKDLVAVVETSSFQLQDLGSSKISPKYAAITNLYVDHLDQHASKDEYWQAKANIFNHQKVGDLVIVNDQVTTNLPELNHNQNCLSVDENLVAKITNTVKSNLLGYHNQQNLSLALIAVESYIQKTNDLDQIVEAILGKKDFYNEALGQFQALPHRLEKVHTVTKAIGGKLVEVNFYDDGAATEPDAVISSIKSLTSEPNELLWLFLTGKDKGADVEKLCKTLDEKDTQILKVEYCGEIGKKIDALRFKKDLELINFQDTTNDFADSFWSKIENLLESKIDLLDADSVTKINVVLSPCGSSFDEFDNYKQRSDFWVKKVTQIQ